MEERLPMRRNTPNGMDRNALRIWGMIIIALGALGRGVLQTRLLGIGVNNGQQLLELLNMPGAMTAATFALALQAVESSAVPVFAVLTVEGYLHSKNPWKYFLRVAGLALLSEIPYHFAMDGKLLTVSSRNPVFGIVLALAMLYLFGQFEGKTVKAVTVKTLVFLAAVLWALMLRVQYGASMVFIVLVLWLTWNRPTMRYFFGAAAALCCTVGSPLFLLAPMGFLLAHFYNGEEGNSNRLFQYLLYPVLMLLVGIVGTFAFA